MEIRTVTFTQNEFDLHLHQYVAGCQGLIDNAGVAEKLTVKLGRRYAKIIATRTDTQPLHREQSRVFGFVDTKNGDILKAGGWKGPAMHARGSIFADDYGVSSSLWTGPKYL